MTLVAEFTTERAFQNAVIALAKTCGWRVAHFRPAMMQSGKWATPMQGDPGFPDLVLARSGVVLFVELKGQKGQLGREQLKWGQELADWQMWRPSDWPTIQAALA